MMKKRLLFIAIIMTFSMLSLSQKEVPASIKSAFSNKYPNAQSVKWSGEAKEWEAEFKLDGKKMSASYDETGKWLETEEKIKVKNLPASVTSTIKKEFADFKIEKAEYIEKEVFKCYELKLEKIGKEEKDMEVVIDSNGKTISSKEVKEEDEKDKKGKKDEKD